MVNLVGLNDREFKRDELTSIEEARSEQLATQIARHLDWINAKKVPHPEVIKEGAHFREICLYPELEIVEKVSRASDFGIVPSVLCANEYLGGDVVPFAFYRRDSDELVVYQHPTESIRALIERTTRDNFADLDSTVLKCLEGITERLASIFSKGVFCWDPKLENFGFYGSEVRVLDLGGFKFLSQDYLDETFQLAMINHVTDVDTFLQHLILNLPSQFHSRYRELLKLKNMSDGNEVGRLMEQNTRSTWRKDVVNWTVNFLDGP